jgi:hypothetical protein
MDKIYKLIQNCLLEVEYQDEQWNDIRTAELISEKITKLMLDYTKYVYSNRLLINKKTMNEVMLNEFLSNYKLDLFKL